MKFSEYMSSAARTLPDLDRRDLLADAALGLCGEAREVREADDIDDLVDECSDCWWYVASTFHALEAEAVGNPADNRGYHPGDLYGSACEIAERAKKVRYHGDDIADHADAIRENLRRYCGCLSALVESDEEVWHYNIGKLKKRWPDGFSVEGGGDE